MRDKSFFYAGTWSDDLDVILQVRIQNFLKKEKSDQKKEVVGEGEEDSSKEVAILRQRVKRLIKRNRVAEVQKLLRSEEFESWGRDTQAKVCSLRLS